MLGVSLLGSLRLRLSGKDLRLASRPKVTLLLAYLLLHCRKPVSRDSVAFALWPDDTEEAARSNLRRHLQYLRDALPAMPAPWFLADRRTVQWNPAVPVEVDTDDFERRCADPNLRESAANQYAELLAGSYDDWVVAARERFHRAYVATVWELALQARSRRDSASAVRYLLKILDDDPWREDAVRALMAAYCEGGDRSSALQTCGQFERDLQREMGVSLMPETIALRRAIERGEALTAVPVRMAAPAHRTGPRELPFGGRDAEMATLESAWESALGDKGRFALVVGEAGIGKTRLASEFSLRVERRGRVLWGSMSHPERAPYQAVTEVLRAALAFVDPSTLEMGQRTLLSLLLPEIAGAEPCETLASPGQQMKVFGAAAHVLRALANERPTLIVLEDLHNAGPATLALVEHLKEACTDSPLLILALARSGGESAADIGRLRRTGRGAKPLVLTLGPLSKEASAAIVKSSKLLDAPNAQVERLISTAAGHPLFLTELIDARVETGRNDAPASARLHDVIAERLTHLTAASRFILGAASVVGTSFDLEIVGEITGWSEAQLAQAADELVARRAIRETPCAGFGFEFAHELVATTVYEELEDAQRRRWHRRTARAASRWYASRLEDLSAFVARHYDLGGEGEAAAEQYLTAARAAAAVFANEESLAYAARGLELTDECGALRFDLLALREEVCERVGERATQRIVLDELAAVASVLGDRGRMLEAWRRRESLHRYFGEFGPARQALEELKRLATGDPFWEAIALRDEAVLLVDAGSRMDAYDIVNRATARAEEAAEPRVLVSTLTLRAHVAATLGRIEEARASLARANESAERDGSPVLRMRVAYAAMTVLTLSQEHERVVKAAPALFDLAERVSDREVEAGAHAMTGGALVHLFRVAGARRHLKQAIELYRDTDVNGAAIAFNNLATLELDVGRLDRVDSALAAMEALLGQSDAESQRECLELLRCDVALRRLQYDRALQRARDLAAHASARHNALLEGEGLRCAGVALMALKRFPEAIHVLEHAHTLLLRIGAADSSARVSAELARACALGGNARAETLAREARQRLEASPTAIPPPAFWTVALAFAAIGRAEEFQTTLQRAHAQFATQHRQLRSPADRAAFAAIPGNAELLRAFAAGIGLPAAQAVQ